MEEKKQLYSVYSFRLMKYLDSLGFKFIATKQCEENPTKTIFRYTDSEELRAAVEEYTAACKKYFVK